MTTLARGVEAVETDAPTLDVSRLADVLGWIALVGILAFLAGLRVESMGPGAAPPGPDGGAFLGFARQLRGEAVMLRATLYPPLVPALIALLIPSVGPLMALKLAGALGSVAIGLPAYAIARRALSPVLAVLTAAGTVLGGYHIEVLAFGGYPSLWGEAAMLAALLALDTYLLRPTRWRLLLAGLAISLVPGVHMLATIVAAPAAAILIAWRLPLVGLRATARRVVALASTAALFSLPYAPTYVYILREANAPTVNMHGWTFPAIGEVFTYVFRNGMGLWYGLLGAAVAVPWIRARSIRALQPYVVALVYVPFALFVWRLEVRVLQYLFAGVLLGAAAAIAVIAKTHSLRVSARIGAVAALAIVVGGAWLGERAWTAQAYPWYRMVSDDTLAALDWVARSTPQSAIVAASVGPRETPMGWWVEGYARRPALTAIAPKWLIYRDEREYAVAANAVFDPRTPLHRAGEVLRQYHVSYLFIDKRALPHAITQFPASAFDLAFENREILILRVR